LADGSVKRESIADFAISEEGYRSQWPSLKKGLAEFGIQLGYSHNTYQYACKEEYDQSLLGTLGKFLKNVVHGIAQVVTAPFRFIGSLFESATGKAPAPQPSPAHPPHHSNGVVHSINTPAAYTQTHAPKPVAPVLHPVQSREPAVAPQWRFNAPTEMKHDAPIQKQPEPSVWRFKTAETAEPAPRPRSA